MYSYIKIPKLICSVIENKKMTLKDDNNQVSVQKREYERVEGVNS